MTWRGRPLVMGILNVTPDSFSDGGRFASPRRAVARGLAMAQEGAEVLDVGGESTRPGASAVPVEMELQRTIPVIERLARRTRVPISIDTSKARVAAEALAAGAAIVNDVTALRGDPDMAGVVAEARAALILMHMRGTPRTMQRAPRYRDVVGEVAAFLRGAAAQAIGHGVLSDRMLLDPGLGFGKTPAHNLALLRRLDVLLELGYPVVVGASRKSFIGRTLGAEVTDRLSGGLGCAAWAWAAGAHLVRVHDVRDTAHLLRMLDAISRGRCGSA